VITDPAGGPREGARVAAGEKVSRRADAQGRTELVIPEAAAFVLAGAVGFEVRRVLLPEPLPPEMTITLDPANRLTLVVRTADGGIPEKGLVVITEFGRGRAEDAPERFGEFADVRGTVRSGGTGMMMASSAGGGFRRGAPAPDAEEWSEPQRGGTPALGKAREVQHSLIYPLDPDGRWFLSGFVPDEKFKLQLHDAWNLMILGETVSVGKLEDRVIRWTLPRPREIAGQIVDAGGGPIAGARVALSGSWDRNGVAADATGHFRLSAIYIRYPNLTIRAPGYVPAEVLGGEGLFLRNRFEMEEARRVVVEILDGQGRSVEAENVQFHTGDGRVFGAGWDGNAKLYHLDDVPFVPGTIIVRKGSLSAESQLGARDLRTRIIVGR
jgi:hypothetical protein